jgi:hypothetical protein
MMDLVNTAFILQIAIHNERLYIFCPMTLSPFTVVVNTSFVNFLKINLL